MPIVSQLEAMLTLDSSGFRAGIDQVNTSTGRLSNSMVVLKSASTAMAATGVVAFMSGAARAAADEEANISRLSNAMTNGGASYDLLGDKTERYIASLQRIGVADDKARDSIATLTQITKSYSRALELMPLTLDLARAKHLDFETAAMLVGRAATGNTALLTRYGIVLEKGATATEALAAMQERFGGAAEEYGKTNKAAIENMQIGLDNLTEDIGGAMGGIAPFVAMIPGIQSSAVMASGGIGALAGAFGKSGKEAAQAAPQVVDLWTGMSNAGLAANTASPKVSSLAGSITKVGIAAAGSVVAIGGLVWLYWAMDEGAKELDQSHKDLLKGEADLADMHMLYGARGSGVVAINREIEDTQKNVEAATSLATEAFYTSSGAMDYAAVTADASAPALVQFGGVWLIAGEQATDGSNQIITATDKAIMALQALDAQMGTTYANLINKEAALQGSIEAASRSSANTTNADIAMRNLANNPYATKGYSGAGYSGMDAMNRAMSQPGVAKGVAYNVEQRWGLTEAEEEAWRRYNAATSAAAADAAAIARGWDDIGAGIDKAAGGGGGGAKEVTEQTKQWDYALDDIGIQLGRIDNAITTIDKHQSALQRRADQITEAYEDQAEALQKQADIIMDTYTKEEKEIVRQKELEKARTERSQMEYKAAYEQGLTGDSEEEYQQKMDEFDRQIQNYEDQLSYIRKSEEIQQLEHQAEAQPYLDQKATVEKEKEAALAPIEAEQKALEQQKKTLQDQKDDLGMIRNDINAQKLAWERIAEDTGKAAINVGEYKTKIQDLPTIPAINGTGGAAPAASKETDANLLFDGLKKHDKKLNESLLTELRGIQSQIINLATAIEKVAAQTPT